jgi:tetratricopeptide (TPR) repeat protein/tRNA A-37 threonylcarbamoyl transferase component Bud32
MQEQTLFMEAMEIGDPAQRAAFLDRACGNDSALRERVEKLLQRHQQDDSFLKSPALAPALTGEYTLDPGGQLTATGGMEGPGTVIGSYKLLQRIGEGGMGSVYMAEQTQPVQRRVALKIIKPGMDSRQVIARFEAERQALALMDHPNIARVFDGDTTATGRPYFVMELVKGVPITRFCDERRLPPRERLELFLQVCQAVQHAHQKGIIHRDLKPSNVLVALYDDKAVPKVIDFGIAKATGQKLTERTMFTEYGQVVGTLEYMSPEQAGLNQLDIDTRSDIYSLGVLLYELLTGSTPLERKRLQEAAILEVLRLIREEEPPKPSTRLSTTDEMPSVAANRGLEPKKLCGLVRGELDWIVMKALEKDRTRRYETANGFALDVQRYLNDEPVLACPPSRWRSLSRLARRNKGRMAVALGLLLALTVAAASIGWAVRDRAAREAEIQREEIARRVEVESKARDLMGTARTLIAENKLAAARQKLAEARTLLENDRSALADLADEVEAGAADLDRFQHFLDQIDRAHQAETAPVLASRVVGDGPPAGKGSADSPGTSGRRPGEAVPFLLQALGRYKILERDDWKTTLEGGLLRSGQVDHLRRLVYEELLWLADDLMTRQQGHRSKSKLSPQEAARAALGYLGKAETAHHATQALYLLRARCHRVLEQGKAARADQRLAQKTAPRLALDHYLRGQAAYDAKELAAGVAAFEAALRLEPTHYWSLMRLGYCWSDLGGGPEDFKVAVGIFSGCILKRPDHAHPWFCRALTWNRLHRYEDAVTDYSRAIELDPKFADAWAGRGTAYHNLGQPARAVADCSEAIKLNPLVTAGWNNRGVAWIDLGQPAKAVADFTRAIALVPELAARVRTNRGHAFFNMGQYDKALADFTRSLELDRTDAGTWLNWGNANLKLARHEEAIEGYSEAIERSLRFARAWNYRGMAYFNLRQYDKAVADHTRSLELDPSDAHTWYSRANAYTALGQDDKAVADYTRAIELDPMDAHSWYNRGTLYWKLRRPREAVEDYSQAIARNPTLAGAWINRGFAYLAMSQFEKAVTNCTRAIELDSELAGAWHTRGRAYHYLGQFDKAIADCSRAIDLEPMNAQFWCDRGLAYLALRQLTKARANCSEAIRLNPKLALAWNTRGAAYYHLGQYEKSVADCTKAIELDETDAEPWNNRALAYLQLGEPAKAVADHSRGLKRNSRDAKAWHSRGYAYLHLNQPARAIADFTRAIDLGMKDAKLFANRGNAYLELHRYEEAVAGYSQAIEQDPKLVEAWFNRATAHGVVGQYDKARKDYEAVLELSPGHVGAHNGLAWLLATCADAKQRDPKRAVEYARKAVQLARREGNCWGTLGVALYRAGDWKGAVAALDRCRKLKKDGHACTWLFLAMAHGKLGNDDEARRAYDQALAWLEKNKETLARVKTQVEELRRFRGEAEEVLGLKKK